MIELVSTERCIKCDLCVAVCPDRVFDAVPDSAPTIARKHDCQTCFLCELYCPADALYVSPNVADDDPVDEADLVARDLLGSYRRAMGWASARPRGTQHDLSYRMFEDDTVQP
jgi:NAD-dependent dihydropyrimidine dehydrogenase PreA subunit